MILMTLMLALAGCATRPTIREVPIHTYLSQYRYIQVGWLPLKVFFDGKTFKDWDYIDSFMNENALQEYMMYFLPDRRIAGARGPQNGIPREGDLYIEFNIIKPMPKGNIFPNALFVNARFYDIQRQEKIYEEVILVNAWGSGHYAWGKWERYMPGIIKDFRTSPESSVDQCIYNLVERISKRFY